MSPVSRNQPFNWQPTRLRKAIALACITLATAPFAVPEAQAACGTGVVNGFLAGCTLNAGESVIVGSMGASGTISSSAFGVIVNGAPSSIQNNGTIRGNGSTFFSTTGIGVAVNNDLTGGINNTGTIQGAGGSTNGIGVRVSFGDISGSGIVNSGTISATGDSAIAILVRDSDISGGITNSGLIKGSATSSTGIGIRVDSFSDISGGITNSGTISGMGSTGTGIRVTNSDISGGITNNAGGIIRGSTSAILLTNIATPILINNSGLLDGGVSLDNSILNLQGTSGRVTGAVSGNAGSTVNVSGTFTTENTFNVDNFNILGGGIFNIANGVTATSGVSNSAGTLSVPATAAPTITGNYTQTGTGVLEFGATSVAVYGQLTVTGTADLSANNQVAVKVTPGDTLMVNDVLVDTLTAGTLTAGVLSVTDNSALLDFSAVVDGNTIDITVNAAAGGITVTTIVADAGLTSSLGGAATVLDGLLASGATDADMQVILNALNALGTPADIAEAVEQMVPALTGGVAHITNSTLAGIVNAINIRLGHARGGSTGDQIFADRYFWMKPFYSDVEQDNRQSVAGYDGKTIGLIIGADAEVSDRWRIGGALGYSQSDYDSNSTVASQNIDADTWSAALYAEHSFDPRTYLTMQTTFGYGDYDSRRGITFGGVARTASADYNSWQLAFNAVLERGYQLNDKTTISPNVFLDYRYADIDSYTETGAGALNLRVSSDSADTLILGVGARADYKVSDPGNLSADLSVGYDAQADRSSLSSSFSGGGAAFITRGIKPASTVWQFGLGYEHITENGLQVNVRYDHEHREDFDDQALSGNLRWAF